MKICSKCKEKKELEDFVKNKNCKDGYATQCKKCFSDWYEIKKEEHKLRSKKYYKNHIEEHKERSKKYKIDFLKANPTYHKDYRKNNKEKIKQYFKNHYSDNNFREEHLKRIRKWKENNPNYDREHRLKNIEVYRKNSRENSKKRRNKDISYKITENLRCRFYQALKYRNNTKINSIIKLIGCSLDELKQHLESQFKPEMNWDNHGIIWEIDHIKPCVSFNLIDPEQQKQCFHYTNLQLLFKTNEVAKSFGYIDEIGNGNKGRKNDEG